MEPAARQSTTRRLWRGAALAAVGLVLLVGRVATAGLFVLRASQFGVLRPLCRKRSSQESVHCR